MKLKTFEFHLMFSFLIDEILSNETTIKKRDIIYF